MVQTAITSYHRLRESMHDNMISQADVESTSGQHISGLDDYVIRQYRAVSRRTPNKLSYTITTIAYLFIYK